MKISDKLKITNIKTSNSEQEVIPLNKERITDPRKYAKIHNVSLGNIYNNYSREAV